MKIYKMKSIVDVIFRKIQETKCKNYKIREVVLSKQTLRKLQQEIEVFPYSLLSHHISFTDMRFLSFPVRLSDNFSDYIIIEPEFGGGIARMIIDFNYIKFRAWDSNRNKWVYFALHEIININPESSTEDEWAFTQFERVGRYIGFHDKNDKEIYEDDIVKHQDVLGAVEFRKDCGCWDIATSSGYLCMYNKNWSETEIVGNIYDTEINNV